MLCMGRCWACDGELDPAWKFCINCGIPIERDEAIPAAIRLEEAPPMKSSTLRTFGWIMVGIGALLVTGGVLAVMYLDF
jgi:predicted nucleic acid-binding Zn ribbon protein